MTTGLSAAGARFAARNTGSEREHGVPCRYCICLRRVSAEVFNISGQWNRGPPTGSSCSMSRRGGNHLLEQSAESNIELKAAGEHDGDRQTVPSWPIPLGPRAQ